MNTVAIDATIVYTINGVIHGNIQYVKEYNVVKEGDIISPFFQSYKFKVKSVEFAEYNFYKVNLEPFCESSKVIYNSLK